MALLWAHHDVTMRTDVHQEKVNISPLRGSRLSGHQEKVNISLKRKSCQWASRQSQYLS